SGPLKVAVLLHALGETKARAILELLSGAERDLIREHIGDIGAVAPDVVEMVADEFTTEARRKKNQATMAERSGRTLGGSKSKLDVLHALDPDQIIGLIAHEHPQTMALVVAHLSPDAAGEVLVRLPEEIRVEVAMRVANLDKVLSDMVDEIDYVLSEILRNQPSSATHRTGGVDHLAEILNMSGDTTGDQLLGDIEEINPELAAMIKERMFVFDDLILVDDRGFQKVLRQVETKELAVALKAASEEIRQKVFRNMSQRAAEMLEEEIEAMGAIRMAEVEDAQAKITRIIQDMESKGELVISGRGGGDFVE
ncbi:MAG: flagellar motor switch protein FliG, partial [Desulfobacterales bacterium]